MKVYLLLGSVILAGCVSTPVPEPEPVTAPLSPAEEAPAAVAVVPNHVNWAREAAISASSTSMKWEGEGAASAVADGDLSTRWASEASDAQQLSFDFGEQREVHRLRILWETASAAEFAIQLSDDGQTWRTVSQRSGGLKGPRTDEIAIEPVSGRWLRLDFRARATEFAYSIYEVEIY
ncbi:MAG: hypothetical protein ACI8W8_003837 [Rhodothermales bacterium]|jgi:hypothetical protein